MELVVPPGYNYYNKSRANRRGGGIMFIFREHFKFTVSSEHLEAAEILRLSLKLENTCPIIVTVIYRPPNASTSAFIAELHSLFAQDILTNSTFYT